MRLYLYLMYILSIIAARTPLLQQKFCAGWQGLMQAAVFEFLAAATGAGSAGLLALSEEMLEQAVYGGFD